MSGSIAQASQSLSAEQVMLELRDVRVHFGGLRALDGVSLSIGRGEALGLVGPNGSGKTTLLNVISGIYGLSHGEIVWKGERIRISGPWHAFSLGISRTFQGVELVPELTALENVLVARHRRARASWVETCVWFGRPARKERRERAAATEILERLGVADCAHSRAGSLPLGTQKIVAIARALAASPRLLLLDEPTAGLSWPDKERLAATILRFAAEERLALIWVEHDLQVIRNACSRVIVLHEGKKLAEGQASEVFSDPRVLEVYSGFRSAAADGNRG